MKKKVNKPIRKKEDVQRSNDERIDQDFPGYPHHPAKNETITHNGSANAFSGTEYDGEAEERPREEEGGEEGRY